MRAPTVSSLRTYNISTSGTSHRFPSCGLFVCTRMRTHTRILMRKPNRFFFTNSYSVKRTCWKGLTIQRDRTIMSTSRRTLPLGEDKSFAHASVSWASYTVCHTCTTKIMHSVYWNYGAIPVGGSWYDIYWSTNIYLSFKRRDSIVYEMRCVCLRSKS